MKLTDWMPVGTVPTRPGVYELEEAATVPDRIFAFWDGINWSAGAWLSATPLASVQATIDRACGYTDKVVWPRAYRWRGVAK